MMFDNQNPFAPLSARRRPRVQNAQPFIPSGQRLGSPDMPRAGFQISPTAGGGTQAPAMMSPGQMADILDDGKNKVGGPLSLAPEAHGGMPGPIGPLALDDETSWETRLADAWMRNQGIY